MQTKRGLATVKLTIPRASYYPERVYMGLLSNFLGDYLKISEREGIIAVDLNVAQRERLDFV